MKDVPDKPSRADYARMQQALSESERRYDALFRNRTHAIAHCRTLVDASGHPADYVVEEVNAAYEEIAGIKRAAVEGRVLVDCEMPAMNGFDATRALRAEERDGARVPVIAMTASALKGDREKCLAAGMDDFLPKPVHLQDLRCMVEAWFRPRPAASPWIICARRARRRRPRRGVSAPDAGRRGGAGRKGCPRAHARAAAHGAALPP